MDTAAQEIRRLHTTLIRIVGVAVVALLVIFVVAPDISHQRAIHKAELACLKSEPYLAAVSCDDLDRLRGQ